MLAQKPILVTGSHRSGTTWVGRMIAEASNVIYIHEPFSVSDPPSQGICNTRFNYWFTYITNANEQPYYRPFKHLITLRYDWIAALQSAKSRKDLRTLYTEYRHFNQHRFQKSRPLLKDPIAFFSAQWLADRFDMDVIMLIRHPAAFVSSIKKLNWSHPFSHFLAQPSLMQEILFPFEPEIREYADRDYPIFDQSILLWRIIHHTILRFQTQHSSWLFIRHEDISRHPVQGFQDVFSTLNLEFTAPVKLKILDYSGSMHPGENHEPVGSEGTLKRNSLLNSTTWKNRLTSAEIEHIRTRVEDISQHFYSDRDW